MTYFKLFRSTFCHSKRVRFGCDAQEVRQARRCARISVMRWIVAHGNTSIRLSLVIVTMGKFRFLWNEVSWIIKNKVGDFQHAQQGRVKPCQTGVNEQRSESPGDISVLVVQNVWCFHFCRRLNLTSRNSPSRPPSSPATPSPRCTAPCSTGTTPPPRASSSFKSPLTPTSPTSPCKSRAGHLRQDLKS